jgi:hypothetical protein
LRVAPLAGLALHTIRLRGALSTDQPIHDRQFDLAARVGVAAMYRVGRDLDVGVGITTDFLLDRQDYKAATMQVLVVPRLQAMVGVLASFRVL